jgi:hypothetical protein
VGIDAHGHIQQPDLDQLLSPEARARYVRRGRLRRALAAAIRAANWYPEQNDALWYLAAMGFAD